MHAQISDLRLVAKRNARVTQLVMGNYYEHTRSKTEDGIPDVGDETADRFNSLCLTGKDEKR